MKEKNGKARRAITSEIARLSGVSRSTVSAVLNGKRNVRESTRSKVMECIRTQNYDLGMISRTLIGEMSRTVAVLASDLGSQFHAMVFRGISDVLEKHGYHILFHNVRSEDQVDPQMLATLHAYRPAGYIILKGAEGLGGEHAKKIIADGIPLVTQGALESTETHAIEFDNRLGMRLATDYAIEKGHRSLGHIAGPVFSLGAKFRKLGFIESLVNHDIPVSDALIIDAGETAAAGYPAALEMLRNPAGRPTALLCFNDMCAMGVYRAAHELDLGIPGELSVVGFDGIDFTALMAPPLTTVDIFPVKLGEEAAELLVKVIKNQTGRSCVTQWVQPRLIERNSVAQL